MSVLEILKYPEYFLKTKTKPVTKIDGEIKKLISDMADTMYFAKGIGLAATQIGINKQIAVVEVNREQGTEGRGVGGKNLIILINPNMTVSEGEIIYEEGCLSIPGVTAKVKRFEMVVVQGIDINGKDIEIRADGLISIAIQHEIDHLNGILFIDRLSKLKREMIKRKIKKAIEDENKRL